MMAVVAAVVLLLHFWTGWQTALNDAAMPSSSETHSNYFFDWLRDTLENLHSEYWQLAVQFALLAGFLNS